MIGLLRSEIRRLTSRRLARVVALVVLGTVLLILGRTFQVSSGGDPAAQRIRATQQAAADRAECERAADQGVFFEPCDQITPERYFDDPRLHAADVLPDATKAVAIGVTMFAFLVGASYVGAEWSAGTMQALLFWEPRRGRVLLAKGVALVAVVLAFFVVVEIVVYGGLWLIASTRGTTDGVTSGLHLSNLLTASRGAVVVAFTALLAYAVAGLTRHSAASLFGGFVYFAVVENLIRALRPGWQRYLIGENTTAVIDKQVDVAPAHARTIVDGVFGANTYTLTGNRAALTLGVYLALLLGAFYLAFTRRDVT